MSTTYPISAAAKLTGISLDTLRAWERRYGAVVPIRSQRGRVYSERQIKRLLLLGEAVKRGHAIGQVATVPDRQLREILEKSSSLPAIGTATGSATEAADQQELLQPILTALDRFDYAGTDREINRLAASIANPKQFVYQVALPLMRTIGESWHAGKSCIAQEHMLTNILSALLASFLRTFTPSNPQVQVVIATPRNERHAFPTLAAAFLTAFGGLGVIYLGTDLPAEDIVLVARKRRVDVVLLSLSSSPGKETLEDLNHISRTLPRSTTLWLGGSPDLELDALTGGSRWFALRDFPALEQELAALGGRF